MLKNLAKPAPRQGKNSHPETTDSNMNEQQYAVLQKWHDNAYHLINRAITAYERDDISQVIITQTFIISPVPTRRDHNFPVECHKISSLFFALVSSMKVTHLSSIFSEGLTNIGQKLSFRGF